MGLTSRARIIVISQFFGPDQSAVGQFLADFANGAAEVGHDVRVVCGADDYASEEVAARGSTQRENPESNAEQPSGRGSIHVARVRTATFSQSKLKKLLSYATFYAGAVWRALRIPKPDVVLTLTAPPGLAWIGWLLQQIRGCRHVAWEMDLYPDIAIALDIPVARWTSMMLDFPRRRADAVIAPGDCMKIRLLQHRIPEDRIVVAENWADGRTIFPLPFPAPPPLRILYSGNLGSAHDVATIRAVMVHLANHPDFQFVFTGGGLERRELIEFCQKRGIENVSFPSYVRLQDLGASLAECHLGLVTQKPVTLGAVVPSKIYGLMAAGRPVLYIGPAEATPALLIRRFECGWHFDCGDEAGVSAFLLRLVENPEELRRKGQNGREAFIAGYDKPAGVARVMRALGLEAQSDC
ncbi:MAG: glycosyltransferase family 4 protein [Terracidiphilus sp.]|jgi:glycosyltransferase involved in cell wall biosynthesis